MDETKAVCEVCRRTKAARGEDRSVPPDPECWAEFTRYDHDKLDCVRIALAVEKAAREMAERDVAAAEGRERDYDAAQKRIEALEGALRELLRLYDWRFVLAERENDPRDAANKDFKAETRRLLNQYGTEKKAAWGAARAALASPSESAPQPVACICPRESIRCGRAGDCPLHGPAPAQPPAPQPTPETSIAEIGLCPRCGKPDPLFGKTAPTNPEDQCWRRLLAAGGSIYTAECEAKK